MTTRGSHLYTQLQSEQMHQCAMVPRSLEGLQQEPKGAATRTKRGRNKNGEELQQEPKGVSTRTDRGHNKDGEGLQQEPKRVSTRTEGGCNKSAYRRG